MSTTERPHYTKTAGFRMIHTLDPHLLCVPSLHVVIVTLARIYYGGVFKQLHIDEAERKLYEKELKDGKLDIDGTSITSNNNINILINDSCFIKFIDSLSVLNQAKSKIDEKEICIPGLDEAIREFENGETISCKDFSDYQAKMRE